MADATLPVLTSQPRFVDCGGRMVSVWPLTISDIGAWDQWARQEFLRATLELVDKIKSRQDRYEHRTVSVDQATQISLGSPKGSGLALSIPGMLQVCWLAMRHGEMEKLTAAEAWQAIAGTPVTPASFKNLKAVFTEAMIASGLAEEADRDSDPTTLVTRMSMLLMG